MQNPSACESRSVALEHPNAPPWHSMAADEVCRALRVTPSSGLPASDAAQRLAMCGPNCLRAERHESLLEEIVEELREPMILLMLATGAVDAVVGGIEDALTIFAIILFVLGVELVNERRAEVALASLRKLAEPTVLVARLAVNVLAALWIGSAAWRTRGATRGIGVFVALDTAAYSAVGALLRVGLRGHASLTHPAPHLACARRKAPGRDACAKEHGRA